MAYTGEPKRDGSRVPGHYTIRVKRKESTNKIKWDVSIIRNISSTGVLFYSPHHYEPGLEVELKIMNPILAGEISCSAKVARCFPTGMSGVYGVALEFKEIAPLEREALDRTINLFLKKKEEDA